MCCLIGGCLEAKSWELVFESDCRCKLLLRSELLHFVAIFMGRYLGLIWNGNLDANRVWPLRLTNSDLEDKPEIVSCHESVACGMPACS